MCIVEGYPSLYAVTDRNRKAEIAESFEEFTDNLRSRFRIARTLDLTARYDLW